MFHLPCSPNSGLVRERPAVAHSLAWRLWGDLIILSPLNCHLTGKSHSGSTPPSTNPTPCPWSHCGNFPINISGEEGARRGQGWFLAALGPQRQGPQIGRVTLGKSLLPLSLKPRPGSAPRSIPAPEGEPLLLQENFPAPLHLSGVRWELNRTP